MNARSKNRNKTSVGMKTRSKNRNKTSLEVEAKNSKFRQEIKNLIS